MRVIRGYIFAFVFVFMIAEGLFAQHTMTSSPYSMFGLGEMASGLYGQNVSMAGVSIGMRDGKLINGENPAGLTAMDTCSLLAEASAFIKSERYQSRGDGTDAFTGNFSAFSLGGRLMRRWYAAVGLIPYSFVGYYFRTTEDLEGAPGSYVSSAFEGSGGLSKAYLSQGFALTRYLSVGVNLNYIFGNMTQGESQSSMAMARKISGSAFHAEFGVQYHRPIGRETYLTLGAVYGYKQRITLRSEVAVAGSDAEATYEKRTERQYLPPYLGVGAVLTRKKWTYALDYRFRQYSVINSDESRATFRDAHESRLGVCFAPGGFGSDSYWKRMAYKMGVSVAMPYYLRWKGGSGFAYRVSAGLDFPLLEGRLNAAFFYDYLRLSSDAMERSLLGFTLAFTLSERLYRVKL